ncbi:MAG: phosphotyrosine protein phosphatase [Butyrivibrio sp.]|nr:phosphotyrosine protein phosphatase [Butyrivibrio sp.]
MAKYNRLIFVCTDNLCRSPMAEAVMKRINRTPGLEICSRGLIVLFPEPYNPRATAVLRNSGIILENGLSELLKAEDFGEDVLVLTMDRTEKQKILEEFENAVNVYTIMEFAGGSGDIMDPYGGDKDVYALFLESINTWVAQTEQKIYEINSAQDAETKEKEQ